MHSNSEIINSLEKDIANLLLDKLEFADMSFERASVIAKFVLAHLPEDLTDKKLKQILPSLDDEFIELAGIVHKYINEYEEKEKENVTNNVQALIQNGRLEEASSIMKNYFNKRLSV